MYVIMYSVYPSMYMLNAFLFVVKKARASCSHKASKENVGLLQSHVKSSFSIAQIGKTN